jgi:hypothetical protein
VISFPSPLSDPRQAHRVLQALRSPDAYLTDVLTRPVDGHLQSSLGELTPGPGKP